MNRILRREQLYKPYWVRRAVFELSPDDRDNFCNMINQNTNIIHFGYGPFRQTETSVNIPLYYLKKEELDEAIKATDLKYAPNSAVEWKNAPLN